MERTLIPILICLSLLGCASDADIEPTTAGVGVAASGEATTHTEGHGNKITTINMTGASLSMAVLGFGAAVFLFLKYRSWKKVSDSMITAIEKDNIKGVKERIEEYSRVDRVASLLSSRVKQLTGR